MMSKAGVIELFPRSNDDIRISNFRCVLLEVRTPIRAASGMGHWRGMNTVTCHTDYYYYCYITKLYRLLPIHEFQTQVILLILDYYWQNTGITDYRNADKLTDQ